MRKLGKCVNLRITKIEQINFRVMRWDQKRAGKGDCAFPLSPSLISPPSSSSSLPPSPDYSLSLPHPTSRPLPLPCPYPSPLSPTPSPSLQLPRSPSPPRSTPALSQGIAPATAPQGERTLVRDLTTKLSPRWASPPPICHAPRPGSVHYLRSTAIRGHDSQLPRLCCY